VRSRRIHDLPGVSRQRAIGAGLEISLSHDLPGRVADRDGAATDHDIGPVPSRRPLPLLALALLGPFLGDALDGVDDG